MTFAKFSLVCLAVCCMTIGAGNLMTAPAADATVELQYEIATLAPELPPSMPDSADAPITVPSDLLAVAITRSSCAGGSCDSGRCGVSVSDNRPTAPASTDSADSRRRPVVGAAVGVGQRGVGIVKKVFGRERRMARRAAR